MSGINYSGSETNQEIDRQGPDLPGYVPYLSLVFKLIATSAILSLSGWVVYTIKVTRSLHRPHNIFVANLLIAGMVTTLIDCVMATTMITSYALGVESFVSCYVMKLRLIPYNEINLSFVIIAADKVVALTIPLRYKHMITHRVVAFVIGGTWLTAVLPTAWTITFNMSDALEVPQYGACFYEENAFITVIFVFILPIVVASILTVILNVQLAIKAYRVHKQIEKETRLSGSTGQSVSSKKKQHNIRRSRKPIITLLVVILGSAFIPLLLAPLHIGGRFLIESQTYQDFMEYIIVVNIGYIIRLFHPIVYGLYFNQIREPMMKYWRRFVKIKKVNSVAPQP